MKPYVKQRSLVSVWGGERGAGQDGETQISITSNIWGMSSTTSSVFLESLWAIGSSKHWRKKKCEEEKKQLPSSLLPKIGDICAESRKKLIKMIDSKSDYSNWKWICTNLQTKSHSHISHFEIYSLWKQWTKLS